MIREARAVKEQERNIRALEFHELEDKRSTLAVLVGK